MAAVWVSGWRLSWEQAHTTSPPNGATGTGSFTSQGWRCLHLATGCVTAQPNLPTPAHQLSDSEPQEVNTSSSGAAPSMAATRHRARSTAALQGRPYAWPLLGLPKAVKKGSISAATCQGQQKGGGEEQ